jgi:hypothetical protein
MFFFDKERYLYDPDDVGRKIGKQVGRQVVKQQSGK